MELKEGYVFGGPAKKERRLHIYYEVFKDVSLCLRNRIRSIVYIYGDGNIREKYDNLICKNCLRKYNSLIEGRKNVVERRNGSAKSN